MIERLEGLLVRKTGGALVLAVGPIWLEVAVPLTTSEQFALGETAAVWIHLQWKEDGPSLFGFATLEERVLFRLLVLVQGVGPRIALAILTHFSTSDLVRELRQRNEQGLRRVPGVGPKTAARILVELGPRADQLEVDGGASAPTPEHKLQQDDAIQALTALGYPRREAERAIETTLRDAPEAPLDERLRLALRHLRTPLSGRAH